MEHSQKPMLVSPDQYEKLLPSNYSNRVVLKTILERSDGGLGLVGQRLVVGGWVKSAKEAKKEPLPPPRPQPQPKPHHTAIVPSRQKDVTCVEILQSKIPLFRSIMKVFCSAGGEGSTPLPPVREKLESPVPIPPTPSIVYLLVSDGSSTASLQVTVESVVASPGQLLPIGTCILAEGVLRQTSEKGKHHLELKVERILHLGTVEEDKYPLSKKRLPLEMLRDCPHFRPRTTTVATVMRIRNAMTIATHKFFQNHKFLCVQVPVITAIDNEGFSEKFQITTAFGKEFRKVESKTGTDIEGVSLETVKTAVKEKSNIVEELKRSESNREALVAALQDLQKTNQLASQLEAKEKIKSATSMRKDQINSSEDFFSNHAYLTVSGRLHLESYACSLGNVYAFGPSFRADKSQPAKHAAEMWMVEVEMAFSQLEDAMNCAGDYFKFLCKWVLENCQEDMKFVAKRIDDSRINRLQSMTMSSFEKVSYMDAVDTLKKVTNKTFETKLEWGVALTDEHLSYMADEIYKKPIIVYDYPKDVKPFYVRLNDDGKTVAAFDMVVPKVGTLVRGSQNEERLDNLNKRIKELGLPNEQYEWYLDLRRHGTVKHSGFSLAFDLMVLFTTGLADVRDAIPFPRSSGRVSC